MTKPTDLQTETKPPADIVIAELVNVETILLNDKHKSAACRVVDGRELIDDLQTENESLRARVAELEEENEELRARRQDMLDTDVNALRLYASFCEANAEGLHRTIRLWKHDGQRKDEKLKEAESQLTQLRREIEAMREELNEYKWHDVNELYPPTNKDVEICWRHSNGVTGKNVGHMNAFNQWWVKDTWVDGITHWRYIIDPRSTAKGGE